MVYMIAPDVYEGKLDTLCVMAAVWIMVWMTISFVGDACLEIRDRRNALSIAANRQTRGNRDNLVTDIRIRRRSRAIEIPAEKVQ